MTVILRRQARWALLGAFGVVLAMVVGGRAAWAAQALVRPTSAVVLPETSASGAARGQTSGPSLVAGRLQAVEAAQSRFLFQGRWVRWVPGRVRVLSATDGAVRDVSVLRPGLNVRLALDPSSSPPSAATAVLIYVEELP